MRNSRLEPTLILGYAGRWPANRAGFNTDTAHWRIFGKYLVGCGVTL